ncbi:MAG: AlpA family transcriptional regulator [Pseudomonadota bacterium]|nr:AlpA family transcriptional regulator [Pseudomonadota bacterium]
MSNCETDAVSENTTLERTSNTRGRLIRLPEVMDRVGMKRSAIYQRMREGSFPRSRSLGSRCAVWVEAEIDDWIQQIMWR